jgi:hypothetical protein
MAQHIGGAPLESGAFQRGYQWRERQESRPIGPPRAPAAPRVARPIAGHCPAPLAGRRAPRLQARLERAPLRSARTRGMAIRAASPGRGRSNVQPADDSPSRTRARGTPSGRRSARRRPSVRAARQGCRRRDRAGTPGTVTGSRAQVPLWSSRSAGSQLSKLDHSVVFDEARRNKETPADEAEGISPRRKGA